MRNFLKFGLILLKNEKNRGEGSVMFNLCEEGYNLLTSSSWETKLISNYGYIIVFTIKLTFS